MAATNLSMARTGSVRIVTGFWLLGLFNNVLYVVILSAALDLVGPSVPKGLVLLADVLPSFLVKLTAPYYIHVIPYPTRVISFALLSAMGMLIIALSSDIAASSTIFVKLFGVSLASLSSGGGELSFLGLTHFYGLPSLAAWGSGTGAAGLLGAGAYVVATTTLGLSSRASLLIFSVLPVVMLLSFFVVLPPAMISPGVRLTATRAEYESVPTDEEHESCAHEPRSTEVPPKSGAGSSLGYSSSIPRRAKHAWYQFKGNLHRTGSLFLPYMLPLLLVYIAEYTINQGVAPTLLFDPKSTPLSDFRDFYPVYNAIYQLGVFISRSSTPWIRIHHLYAPSFLQLANLMILSLHALFDLLPNIYFVFIVFFWEGLLGGVVYVNTFAQISDNVPLADREFSLSATTVSDSGGICIAAFISMAAEKFLCDWQVAHLGRNWCRQR